MANAARQPGYYWVRVKADNPRPWEVAEWDEECGFWMLTGTEVTRYESDMAEIDERRIERG